MVGLNNIELALIGGWIGAITPSPLGVACYTNAMTEKAVATTNIMDTVHRGGNVALVTTVHSELDTVVGPDGKLIIGVSQQPGGKPRTLDLKRVVAHATDIVEQGGSDARRTYGEVYVVVGRPDGQGGQILQETIVDYPNKRIITNPGTANQHVYPADGLPQRFTTDQPYEFVPRGGSSSHPKKSSGLVLAAYMHAPEEGAAVQNFDPAAIARGDFATLTHAYLDPARPLTAQGLREAPVADRDPIAEAVAAAHRVVPGPGSGAQGLH